jgi:hypothetical protein
MLATKYARCINECVTNSDLRACCNYIFKEETNFFIENKIYSHELFNYLYDEKQKRDMEAERKERVNKVNTWFAALKH